MNSGIQYQLVASGSVTESSVSALVSPYTFDDSQITVLRQFFETLDRWDQELSGSDTSPRVKGAEATDIVVGNGHMPFGEGGECHGGF